MVQLAAEHRVLLPDALTKEWPPRLRATDERGWFRFQRLYDTARSVVRDEAAIRRLVHEAAEDEAAEGSRWLEIQIDPTSYAPRVGGLTPAVEIVLDAAGDAARRTGVGIGVVIAANRMRHPLEARTLARLAAQYAGRGVVGFGLSNDERRGRAEDFDRAFAIARRAGLLSVPHGGELSGPASVVACVDALGARRVGHGVRSVEDPALLARLAEEGVTLEVCPSSNVALGVYETLGDVPLRRLQDAGISVALGADDPLLFGSRLLAQYEAARDVLGFGDADLAGLALQSISASTAPDDLKARARSDVEAWLCATPA
jgi:adenosine deaminase